MALQRGKRKVPKVLRRTRKGPPRISHDGFEPPARLPSKWEGEGEGDIGYLYYQYEGRPMDIHLTENGPERKTGKESSGKKAKTKKKHRRNSTPLDITVEKKA